MFLSYVGLVFLMIILSAIILFLSGGWIYLIIFSIKNQANRIGYGLDPEDAVAFVMILFTLFGCALGLGCLMGVCALGQSLDINWIIQLATKIQLL